jgi:hypothetical protein
MKVLDFDIETAEDAINLVKDKMVIRAEPRDMSGMKVGELAHQGDVLIMRMDKAPDPGIEVSRQLAPGTSVGSNHVVTEMPGVAVRAYTGPLPFSFTEAQRGPCIIADRPWSVTHPKHGNMVNFPAGEYIALYQLDWKTQVRRND